MTTPDLFAAITPQPEVVRFDPTRQAGLARLNTFASRTGQHYASQRNYDFGPDNRSTVSALSPWIKHRLITEEEVLTQTLARHSTSAAMKFVQEVFWRGYFKGWLEQHPSVWAAYKSGLNTALENVERHSSLKTDYIEALSGRTGIACFDHWCAELKSTGYLHNHARMWFASIWIFTLRLPWELGAHFFMSHLIDGDVAANTLSWRWVGGLHTKGKTYLARASNIAQFTGGRFEPAGQLAQHAEPLVEDIDHPMVPLPQSQPIPSRNYVLLITPEDCHPDAALLDAATGVLGLSPCPAPHQSAQIHAFQKGAVTDALARSAGNKDPIAAREGLTPALIQAAKDAGTTHIVTPRAAIGPIAEKLRDLETQLHAAGLHLHLHERRYDRVVWPHASKGFFKLKKQIPTILSDLGRANFQPFQSLAIQSETVGNEHDGQARTGSGDF